MASGIYNHFKAHILGAKYNLASGGDVIKVALFNNSHSFTAENDGLADITANQLSTAGGYTSGGATLGSQAVSIDDTDDEGVFDGADTSWTSASFSAYHAVLYDDTMTTPTADGLICSFDFGGIQTVTSGTFLITWAAEGIVNIT